MKKKKDYLNCLKKICKSIRFIFNNLIFYGVIVGVISGLIVTFFFYTPKISLINTIVRTEDDKYYFDFIYENKGQSPAINIDYIYKFKVLYKNEIIAKNNILLEKQVKLEVGDMVTNGFSIDAIEVGKDIFENSELIILNKINYEDSYKFRTIINKRLLNNQYSGYRLAFYDVSKKGKHLSVLSLEKRNEFKEMIDKWIEELENGVSNYDQTRTREI